LNYPHIENKLPGVTNMANATVPEGTSKLSHLSVPASVQRWQVLWPYAISLTVIHLLALLAFVPWLFSWTGVILAACGLYVFGTLGINLCYHRLLTHSSFSCPKWLEHFFAILGVCCLQDTPGRWVAIHRFHHQHSDEQPDPHSPLVNFIWGHFGWLMVKNDELHKISMYERYARDILRDPFYLRLEKRLLWVWVYLVHAVLFLLAGLGIGWLLTGEYLDGVQFGLSLLVWGVFVRTVVVWHITWSVNSITHMWGYRNYETGENSRNNWFVALVSNGEGWHNNHHADQRSAAHGHRWWEFDVTYITIRMLRLFGLAWDVVTPNVKVPEPKPTAR
jgi:fatty-acid desaturase